MKVTLIGKSKAIKNINKQIQKFASRKDDILIIGERGSGKSVVGKKIHYDRVRGNDTVPLIDVKLHNLGEHELSAALFGYSEGTPGLPDTSRNSLTDLVEGGTILIEEIESANYRNQMKLVHFLNELKELRDSNTDPVNVRIIVTTKDNPVKLSQRNEIIPELADHLAPLSTLEIPPLRERKEDIPLLVEHFMNEACKQIGIQEPIMDINALSILVNHEWKNNIRELKTVIDRSVVFSSNGMFMLPQDLIDEQSKVTRMLESVLTGAGQEFDGSLDTIERGLIDSALKRFEFNFSKAAQFLGMNQHSLEHRASQLGLVQGKK